MSIETRRFMHARLLEAALAPEEKSPGATGKPAFDFVIGSGGFWALPQMSQFSIDLIGASASQTPLTTRLGKMLDFKAQPWLPFSGVE